MKLYTNSNETRLENRLNKICVHTNLLISVAFFSHYDFIKRAIKNGCDILLIVRLHIGTSPDELLKIFNDKEIINHINIRYYACNEFHPKFYIVENECAIMGSSNLTHSGIFKNQEVNIEIEKDHIMFEELKIEFYHEWEGAAVLTKEKALQFKEDHDKIPKSNNRYLALFPNVGEVNTLNITNDNKKNISNELIENFRREYQLYISSVHKLIDIYTSVSNNRKYDEIVPIRIEIDRFLSWIKDTKYIGEEYKDRPIKSDSEIKSDVEYLKNEFINYNKNEYYVNTQDYYKEILLKLGTKESIEKLSFDDLISVLLMVNAFHDQLRFFEGGLDTQIKEFKEKNDITKVKETLIYILFGTGDYVIRIFNSISSPKYKLEIFGENSIKELFGLINNENIPTCNGRMLRSMQWLGFGKI